MVFTQVGQDINRLLVMPNNMSQLEKYLFSGFFAIVVIMLIGVGLSAESRKACRMELAKQNRIAEDIVKICP